MAGFKTPLPRLLAELLTHALNEMVRVDSGSNASSKLTVLNKRPVALCLSGVGINLVFSANDGRLLVQAMPPEAFDADAVATTITGTPEALLAMAVPDWSVTSSGVRIEGDAQAAQALEQLMRQLDPDWETLWVERFGAVVGHQLHHLFGMVLQTGKEVSSVGLDQMSRFVREESGWLVDREAFDGFAHAIDELQEGVDRLWVNATRRGLV